MDQRQQERKQNEGASKMSEQQEPSFDLSLYAEPLCKRPLGISLGSVPAVNTALSFHKRMRQLQEMKPITGELELTEYGQSLFALYASTMPPPEVKQVTHIDENGNERQAWQYSYTLAPDAFSVNYPWSALNAVSRGDATYWERLVKQHRYWEQRRESQWQRTERARKRRKRQRRAAQRRHNQRRNGNQNIFH